MVDSKTRVEEFIENDPIWQAITAYIDEEIESYRRGLEEATELDVYRTQGGIKALKELVAKLPDAIQNITSEKKEREDGPRED